MRGLPGSGKSTFAKKLVGADFLVCEADKYFIDKETGEYKFDPFQLKAAHKACQETVEIYMKDSLLNDQFYRQIAVSNTFTQEWEMKPYFELAEKYGYSVFLCRCGKQTPRTKRAWCAFRENSTNERKVRIQPLISRNFPPIP